MELSGARVVITGASRGIGEALAVGFAEAGATVALVARDAAAIDALATSLGGSAHPADLGDPIEVSSLIGRIEEEAGPIDVLVNNAGVQRSGRFTTASAEDLRRATEVNYLAPAELVRQVVPRMLHRGGGHIVNVSSFAATVPMPGLVAYAASKAALAQFTAGLRTDVRGLPIGITLVELGIVPTEMAGNDGYAPTARAARRLCRARLLGSVSREKVAATVVAAVRSDRRHVRLPRRAATLPMLAEAPRRAAELLYRGLPQSGANR